MENNFSDLIKNSIEEEEKKIAEKNIYDAKENKFDFDKLKNKLKRNFFAGFGIGLAVAAIAFWIFQPMTKPEQKSVKDKKVEEMTNAQIIERAKALGMQFPINE